MNETIGYIIGGILGLVICLIANHYLKEKKDDTDTIH